MVDDEQQKRRRERKKLSNFATKSVKNVENNHFTCSEEPYFKITVRRVTDPGTTLNT